MKVSLSKVFCENGILKKFAKFGRKHLCMNFFFNKVVVLELQEKTSSVQVFSCEFSKNFKNNFFKRTKKHLWIIVINSIQDIFCQLFYNFVDRGCFLDKCITTEMKFYIKFLSADVIYFSLFSYVDITMSLSK